jgi:ribonuclease D
MELLGASPLPEEIQRRISRESMLELPIRRYEGEVQVVAAPAEAERALADILQEGVVGFDTETRPAFRKGEMHLPSLVQVATARAVYLFQLQKMDLSIAVAEIFAAPGIVKAGISVADDLKNLKKLFAFEERSVVDIGAIARRHGLKQTGVRNMAGIFLGFRIPKGTKTSNWAVPRLSSQQITYAATDAWACRELFLAFRGLKLAGA